MHRKNPLPHAVFGGLLLLGLLLGGHASAWGQEAQRTITLSVGSTQPVQMTKQLQITRYQNEKPGVVTLAPSDPITIKLTGVAPGTSRVTLFAMVDGKEVSEILTVIVQSDIELLKTILQRTVPEASVTPIGGPNNSIIITGYVAHAEDIDTIMRIAQSTLAGAAGAGQVVNAMKVGGVMQVQLDVVVARVLRDELRRMSVDFWDNGGHHDLVSAPGASFIMPDTIADAISAPAAFVTSSGTITPGIHTRNAGVNNATANIFLDVIGGQQAMFFFIQALRDNTLAKLLAEPHLTTLSGRPATFLAGGDQAVPTVSGFGGTAGVDFKPFGTQLQFLPIVQGNGKIYLEVEPEVTVLDPAAGVTIPGGGLVPGRSTQRVRTSVIMEDGQTFVIGGLIQNRVAAVMTKLPLLGDLPFIGSAFSRKSYEEIEEELVVMVTPHLVDPMDCKQVPRFLPGQETRSPDDFELFLENILEAPRGQREICHDHHYVPAWQNDPSAKHFPCGSDPVPGHHQGGHPGCHGCEAGSCPINGGGSANGTVGEATRPTGPTEPGLPVLPPPTPVSLEGPGGAK